MSNPILRRCALPVVAVACLMSCDDNTGSMGLFPDSDKIINSSAVFEVTSRSLEMGPVRTASSDNYLGEIIDPETGVRIRSEFAAQFFCQEDFRFPDKDLMFPGKKVLPVDSIHCDSVELRLYFDSYYGDGGNPMKLEVYPLSAANIMEEDSTYYSNVDLAQFVDAQAAPLASKVFAPIDYTLSDSELESATHSDNIRIILPNSFGTGIMQQYYRTPEHFKDAYSFIRNVFPGFYFKHKSGSGNMMTVNVGTLNVYFTYYSAERPDSAISAMTRFASTPEVIQSTRFENGDMRPLLEDKSCTYLKSPAGVCTELTLPVNEVFLNHEGDSVSKARLTLTTYNRRAGDDIYSLGTPATVLLVRKDEMQSFFENKEVSDALTSYTTSFNSTYNTYTFENLCRLFSYIHREKQVGMAKESLTEAEWEAAHPNWNKCVVIPVKTSTTSDTYGNTYQTSVTHDLDMNSIRLVGGEDEPIEMQVIYSRFK